MKTANLRAIFVFILTLLLCAACADSSADLATPPDGDGDSGSNSDSDSDSDSAAEQVAGFKGGSTVGNPSEVDIRIVARSGADGGPEWASILLGVHNVFLSNGVWNSTSFGEELVADSDDDVNCSIGERSSVRFALEAPPDIEFSSLDLRLSKDSGAFKAEGEIDGRNISIETGLFGRCPSPWVWARAAKPVNRLE